MFGSKKIENIEKENAEFSNNIQKKKKSNKLKYVLYSIVALVVVFIVIANWEGSTNYVSTVEKHKPLTSQGMMLTYADVLNKYIESPKWESSESGDIGYVDISGIIKGSNKKIDVKIKVAPMANDSKHVSIRPESITLNSNSPSTQAAAEQILLYMFSACQRGETDIGYYFN
ncbi:hypothetical protein [Pectinatus brassicae]|uniref:Uncharacterized protein n=1 Tax=Pectinatus brassicae TaxID=862415 RepID=A0A840USZ7_9FIRM|nr:hypothetical protein [Pectinatus brassicae]MBB5335625.1 hypothetical protein [Pectinatus brassicae]